MPHHLCCCCCCCLHSLLGFCQTQQRQSMLIPLGLTLLSYIIPVCGQAIADVFHLSRPNCSGQCPVWASLMFSAPQPDTYSCGCCTLFIIQSHSLFHVTRTPPSSGVAGPVALPWGAGCLYTPVAPSPRGWVSLDTDA